MPPTDREALTDAGQERCNEEAAQALKTAADRVLREMSDSDLADHLDWQAEDTRRMEEDPAPIQEAARRLRSPSDRGGDERPAPMQGDDLDYLHDLAEQASDNPQVRMSVASAVERIRDRLRAASTDAPSDREILRREVLALRRAVCAYEAGTKLSVDQEAVEAIDRAFDWQNPDGRVGAADHDLPELEAVLRGPSEERPEPDEVPPHTPGMVTPRMMALGEWNGPARAPTDEAPEREGERPDRELATAITSVVDHARFLISMVRSHAEGELNVEVEDAIEDLEHSVGWLRRASMTTRPQLEAEGEPDEDDGSFDYAFQQAGRWTREMMERAVRDADATAHHEGSQ